MNRWAHNIAVGGGVCLILSALVSVISIVLRASGLGSIRGDFELAEMALAVAIFSFFPLCEQTGGHIRIETLTSSCPRWVQSGLDRLWSAVSAAVLLGLGGLLGLGAMESLHSHTATAMLGLPVGWAMAGGAVLLCGSGLVALSRAARSVRA